MILARRDIGINHVLRIIKGADRLSMPNLSDILCQREKKWLFNTFKAKKVIIKAFIIDILRYNFLLIIQGKKIADKDRVKRYIIIIVGYSAQSNPPWVHSNISPINKMAKNKVAIYNTCEDLKINKAWGKGNSRAISRSNNRNNMATRKNRKEKGTRADFKGSNPHS